MFDLGLIVSYNVVEKATAYCIAIPAGARIACPRFLCRIAFYSIIVHYTWFPQNYQELECYLGCYPSCFPALQMRDEYVISNRFPSVRTSGKSIGE